MLAHELQIVASAFVPTELMASNILSISTYINRLFQSGPEHQQSPTCRKQALLPDTSTTIKQAHRRTVLPTSRDPQI